MLSPITAPSNNLTLSQLFVGNLNFPIAPSLVVAINRSRTRLRRQQAAAVAQCFNLSLGFGDLKRRQDESSWSCGCKGWESEGDSALEAEIFDFMTKSDRPDVFPTKKEFVDAGRIDLVEAIVKKGGWLALGWDLDSEQENAQLDDIPMPIDCYNDGLGDTQQRVGISWETNSLEEAEVGSPGFSSVSTNSSSQSASPSGRSLGTGADEDTGIEGILSRLEKQRNWSLGIDLGKKGGDERLFKTLEDAEDSTDLERSGKLTSGSANKDIFRNSDGKLGHNRTESDFDGLRNSLEPETWRSWSNQWAGSSDTEEFEAAEISFHENQMDLKKGASIDGRHDLSESATDELDRRKELNHSQIRTRLKQLELELSCALRLLRSKHEVSISKEGYESFSDDLRKLSDDWEFQENEFMNSQDRLRSVRAKLAVLEGKMALAIIDAQKMAEEKQKKIDGSRRALQLLHNACIVWPNTGSEVLLVGSFDGWTTQRKMEKSSTGIFSVCLKLYPGKYEIKFIVDGIWRIDPLRPIVHNNGHQNNLLIIT